MGAGEGVCLVEGGLFERRILVKSFARRRSKVKGRRSRGRIGREMGFDGRNNGKEVGETFPKSAGVAGGTAGGAVSRLRRSAVSATLPLPRRTGALPFRGGIAGLPGRRGRGIDAGGKRHLSCTRNFNRSKEIWSISIPNDGCEARIPRASLLIFGMGLTRASLENHRRGFLLTRVGLPVTMKLEMY